MPFPGEAAHAAMVTHCSGARYHNCMHRGGGTNQNADPKYLLNSYTRVKLLLHFRSESTRPRDGKFSDFSAAHFSLSLSGLAKRSIEMGQHIDDFAIFAAALLDRLYDSFPIPIGISPIQFLESPDINEMLAAIDRAVQAAPEEPLSFARSDAAAREAERMRVEVSTHNVRQAVLLGTIEFLIAEDFVRCTEPYADEGIYRGCQLTAKGFAHLHKEFKDKTINDQEKSIIQGIKERISNASSLEGAVLVGVISKFLS